ncbi:hypothetical protein GCM10022216_13570 [Sphingobacterium kyonggiense]|uniref:FecR family protein n=1 Tax=Sphingobacterium kyonggiense TaxID=714075 RepID=A0ABP7YKH9_9SPHI
MNNTQKEDIGNEIHDRILHSIAQDKRSKRNKRITFIVLGCTIFLLGFFMYANKISLNESMSIHQPREFTADFNQGTYTQKDLFSSKTNKLILDSNSTQAIYQNKSKNLTVLNIAKLDLSNKDILNIKTGVGGFYKVELPDGSIVNLNSKSSLKYQANYMEDRNLTLSGEAYFEVKPLLIAEKKAPFQVKTELQTIEVLGTAFNVKTGNIKDETLLYEGRINLKNKTGMLKKLFPGDLAKINEGNTEVVKLNEGEIEETLAWKEGYLYYNNRTLKHILEDLQKYYDFEFNGKEVPSEYFTIYLAREKKLPELLRLLEKSGDISMQLANNIINFKK